MRPTHRLLLAAAGAVVLFGTTLPARADSGDGWRGGDRPRSEHRGDGGWQHRERHASRDRGEQAWRPQSEGYRGDGYHGGGYHGDDYRGESYQGGYRWYPPPPRAYLYSEPPSLTFGFSIP